MIPIDRDVAKKLARLLGKLEELTCTGCEGTWHEQSCPAREAFQSRNYLTQRLNNPQRHFTS